MKKSEQKRSSPSCRSNARSDAATRRDGLGPYRGETDMTAMNKHEEGQV